MTIQIRLRIIAIRFSLTILLMLICRILFWIANIQHFKGLTIYDFLIGSWFDCITIAVLLLPYIFVFLFPLPVNKVMRIASNALFFIPIVLILALNLMDIEYFKYTSKRSTIDLFAILTAGSDFKQQIGTFIKDFWFLFLCFFLLVLSIYFLDRFLIRKITSNKKTNYSGNFFSVNYLLLYFSTIGMFIFLARGGFVYKPVGVLNVSQYVHPSKVSLILNTPFTMIKSIDRNMLKEVHYYPTIEATEKYFSPIKTSEPQNILPKNTNVVILILESFGREFIGFYNHGKSYTPFLDSLLAESLTFSAGIANGKKSIEALPSIFASIPNLQDNPYISSPYNSNRIISLPELLKQYGYYSAFFHGATNGSMRFDAFTKSIGFDRYIGRKEYGNEAHADATWGILDEYFEPWTAQQLANLPTPFLASLFTLSSHHPFFIPKHREKDVIQGPQPICASISYGDIALKMFFEEAKKHSWYENTLFVLCADHTPGTETPFYNLKTQLYQIPIAFFHPGGKLPKQTQEKIVQQIDIYPTILDLLNIKSDIYTFGSSIFAKQPRYALNFMQGEYYYFENNHMLIFSQSLARNLYDYTSKEEQLVDILDTYKKGEIKQYEKRIKAIIQRYNYDLIHNKTRIIQEKR